ncbi:MAG: sigma-54-dependent Fis family transcriptional regulator [Pirellulales bacterium]|nr:sigma-54-dependent Fis family transcriptional regulator [Pirellulales bacterium]
MRSPSSATVSRLIEALGRHADLWPIAGEILCEAGEAENSSVFLSKALSAMNSQLGVNYTAVVQPLAGRWVVLGGSGKDLSLPVELLAETLDRETPRSAGGWIAVPLVKPENRQSVLVAHLHDAAETSRALTALQVLAPVYVVALGSVEKRQKSARRLRRLEAIQEIAKQWYQTREVQTLLVQMAEAATRLLEADRASIFLWDKPNKTLVGRPALGTPDGELRIPDGSGVVGQVIRDGTPRRVDAAEEPKAINRNVDAQLHYQTRTLLCVPMRSRSGEMLGAFELVNKLSGSFTPEDEEALGELADHAAGALENAQDRQQLLSANRQLAEQAAQGAQLLGHSPPIEALRSIIRRVADTDLAVLILGENGSGKEVVAQSIHYFSRRREQPFVAINCAAIPETLAESELFGHEKGAFTDARETRPGKFELAAAGTLFLDEIGDLSLSGQAKLLRVLEEKVIVRVGGSTPIHTEARVVAASNQDLAEMVRNKKFREDLYFRLNVVTLELPPLRSRGDDILILAEHFLTDFCRRARRRVPPFTAAAKKRLLEHPWPGNVRELRNLMERLAYLTAADRIDADDLAFILSPRGENPQIADLTRPLADATAEFQIQYIRQMIDSARGNMSHAADRLGLHRSNLYRKMRQLGMEVKEEG